MENEVYTVVVETPVGTRKSDFDDLSKAIVFMINERDNEMDAVTYIVDHNGNVINVK